MPAKANFEKKSPPEEMVVVQMTSASWRILIWRSKSAFMLPLPLPLPLPRPLALPPPSSAGAAGEGDLDLEMALSRFFFEGRGLLDLERECERKRAWNRRLSSSVFSLSNKHSKVISSRILLILSGRPTRTALTPSARRPMAMLSTATLLSEVASSGERSSVFDHIFMICTETCVFPVPGGPWITVHVCLKADLTASLWDWLRCVRVFTSARALSSLSDSVPPGLSLASLAAGFSLVSSAAFSAARAAASLSSSVMPPLRHCLDQLSARPTLAVISSSETRGRGFVTRFNIAWSWRS
mmetsp:Transcript_107739/g.327480  ORF Transcript_107739/g.327480 Transcript_107739/m.327480 type:complete len:297 (-) Transcript_107739:319-1209(-)